MAKVIVVTNFSASSRNALDYTCRFLKRPDISVVLLNIFSFSSSMSGDAIAIAAMSETIAMDARKLDEEYAWVKSVYPFIDLRTEMLTGVFMQELFDKVQEEETALVVMGAGGSYTELLSWDANIIDAFVELGTPVLVVPEKMHFTPVAKMAFAVNYYRKNLQTPISMIKRLVNFTGAELYIIHVAAPNEVINAEELESKRVLQESLAELSPVYYEPAFENIFKAIDEFTAEKNINMLLVIPSRHGLWRNIFQQSHTKGLVYLNHIPVMSLYQQSTFI